ncbi:hypothetical protein B0A55_10283 [Friedmanniomyces simplex]|uniref:Protein RTA1 n=1 Tax=Friedmanniomyces simplex TaxID=329884 RepID=A0A4U0WNW9_9PEZI|nr:hypothetical protein B0A55_10283 [Friedmanniomyces simplex]
MAASIYMELGRIILLTDGEAHSPISRRWFTKMFVIGDVFCLLAQSGGGGLSAAGKTIGTKIVIVGLVLQIAVFLCFVAVATLFNMRIRRVPTPRSVDATVPWRRHMTVIYLSSGLIFLRSAVRLAEYAAGFTGYIYTHEWCLYLLDFVPMMVVAVMFVWVHPSEINAWLKGGKAMRGWIVQEHHSVPLDGRYAHVPLV